MIKVTSLTTAYMRSQMYVVSEDGHAVVIDMGDADLIIDFLHTEGLVLDFGILTHEHCDHSLGCSKLREGLGCEILASEKCNMNLQDSKKNASRYYNAFIDLQGKLPVQGQKLIAPFSTHADVTFEKDKTLEWMGHTLWMHETPGHSQGSVCILLDNTILFSGDTLFRDEFTGTGFPGGNKIDYKKKTMPWLRQLSSEVAVYPGHGERFILRDRLVSLI